MFTIQDTSRSLTVALPDKGWGIASQQDGATIHAHGFSFDTARAHMDNLNRLADLLPRESPSRLFSLYKRNNTL